MLLLAQKYFEILCWEVIYALQKKMSHYFILSYFGTKKVSISLHLLFLCIWL